MIIKLKDCEIHVVDSCRQLTAERHKDFHNYLSQENDLGSDIGSLKKRLSEALTFHESDPQASKNAIMNAYFAIGAIEERVNYNSLAFGLLVSKYVIDGKETIPRHSDYEIDETIRILSEQGLTQEILDNAVIEVKKKSNENWPFTIPETTE